MTRSFDRLLRPKSIAVFGGKEAARVVEQCRKIGFDGPIWPVHPTKDEIGGQRCYRSVNDLPAPPDAAFVGVNRAATIDIVRDLAERKAGGAICYASGFREAVAEFPDGADLQDTLVAAAADMPIIGPNCYGFINMLDRVLLWPDQQGLSMVDRGVAILTQSSNIALNISMQTRGLPIAYVLTAGNQAKCGLSDLAMAVLDDPRVTAVGLHIEGIDSLVSLELLALKARQLAKPLVVLKVGRSEAACRAAISHTASLAGNHAIMAALFDRLGIGRANSLPEFLEVLKLLHLHGPLASFDISSMSCSGGEASLMADAGTARNIRFRELQPDQSEPLRQALGPMVTLGNPLDYHTFVWGNRQRQVEAFAAMMRGGYALNLVVLDVPRLDRCDPADWMTTADAVIDAAVETGAKAAIVASMAENMPEEMATRLMKAGVVPLLGIDDALAAAETAAMIGASWNAPEAIPLLKVQASGREVLTLNEQEAKSALGVHGVKVPQGLRAETAEGAANAAASLGFPVVLKALGVAHKTESGAVVLGLTDTDAVRSAADTMAGVAAGFLVEKMIDKPVAEFIIGAVHDPVAGLVLTIGAGGILVELLEDVAILTLPTDDGAIREAIARLKVAKLLEGYRGHPKGDLDALVSTVASVASYVVSNASIVEELDVNPVMVLQEGSGAFAVDALIRLRG